MCIDYLSLNEACPKDPFPLPQIDQIMDSTSGCDLLCFLDAYSGFHQIPMSRKDEEHTAFITVDDLFCYVFMPYGLKNALPTFICALHKTFGGLIRDLAEVYADDIVSYQGIEINLDKIKIIEEMRPPTRIKDVQKLMGCLVMLSWFISRLAERAPPFFKLLQKSRLFH
jgi:hypothetical protein